MKALREILRADFLSEPIIFAEIYDNLQAAKMYDQVLDS
jgi:hypothetical protein